MKLINQSFEIIDQNYESTESYLNDIIYKDIEIAGKNCYQSLNFTETSAGKFVDRMIANKHFAPLEFGTIYLTRTAIWEDKKEMSSWNKMFANYSENPYSKINVLDCKNSITMYVTTNLRVIYENDWLNDLKYLCAPSSLHHKRVMVHLITNRQVMGEITRHRPFSFCIESTRYCNYTQDKYDNELTFIKPVWSDLTTGNYYFNKWIDVPDNKDAPIEEQETGQEWMCNQIAVYPKATDVILLRSLSDAEVKYRTLIAIGWKPQQAATILPNATKCSIYMCGFISDWEHVFDLRVKQITGPAHPQMVELMTPIYNEFIKRNLIDGN